jgi:hypothetical protein
LSWLSYEEQYLRSDLKYLFDLTDLAFFGHIHVEHAPPTIYRDRTFIFESPQVFEHNLYGLGDDDIKLETIHSLGFSVFGFFIDQKTFSQTTYRITDDSLKKNDDSKYLVTWNKSEPKFFTLKRPKKCVIKCFDCLNMELNISTNNGKNKILFLHENCGFRRYLNSIALKARKSDAYSLNIVENLFIDFKGFCEKRYSKSNLQIGTIHGNRLVVVDNFLHFFININKDMQYADLSLMITTYICNVDGGILATTKNIVINIFDYSLFYIFAKPFEDNDTSDLQDTSEFWDRKYQEWSNELECFNIKFKADFFSLFLEKVALDKSGDVCLSKHNLLSDIGISVNIVYLSDYQKFVIKKR